MNLAVYIDHSVLRPNTTEHDIVAGAELCLRYRFAAYCVNSRNVVVARRVLTEGSGIPIAATVAFPFGAVPTAVKVCEVQAALRDGAREIDMVGDIGAMLADDWGRVIDDIGAVVTAAAGATVKVIIETGYLSRDRIRRAIEAVAAAGAGYVKNSSGYGPKGAELEELAWIRATGAATVGGQGGRRHSHLPSGLGLGAGRHQPDWVQRRAGAAGR